jgi:hypothetical protein
MAAPVADASDATPDGSSRGPGENLNGKKTLGKSGRKSVDIQTGHENL